MLDTHPHVLHPWAPLGGLPWTPQYGLQAAVLAAVGSGLQEFMNAHVRLSLLGVSSLFPAQCSGHDQSRSPGVLFRSTLIKPNELDPPILFAGLHCIFLAPVLGPIT